MTAQTSFATALLEPGAPCPRGLKVHNGSDPGARFAVYRNNVVSSLIDALAETFPVSLALVGAEFFRSMARVFVLASPPRSCVLATYGITFADFVESFEPARSVPYLADVARLEMARVLAYHAADCRPATSEAIAEVMRNPELLPELQVTCHPTVLVVRSPFAVVSLWAAHQDLGDLGRVDPFVAEDALVVRSALEVDVARLPHGGAVFIQELAAGRTLAEAAGRANLDAPAFDLPANLAILFRLGAITTLRLPSKERQ